MPERIKVTLTVDVAVPVNWSTDQVRLTVERLCMANLAPFDPISCGVLAGQCVEVRTRT